MCVGSAPKMQAPVIQAPAPLPPPPPAPVAGAQEVLPASGKRMGTPAASTSTMRRGRSGLRIDLGAGSASGTESGLNVPA